MQIAPLLHIGRGITALIGGGGKTTLLYTLAEELKKVGTVILATSTRIHVPKQYETLTAASEAAVRTALTQHRVVCVGETAESGKLGAPQLPFETLACLADYVLVEADGAKHLPLKAHAPHEPVIPANAHRVVLVLGMDGMAKPIREVCHRSAQYAALAGVTEEDVVTAQLAAHVIIAEGFGDRVYLNKVESPDSYAAACTLAQALRCPVVAGSLHQGVYVCLR